MGQFHDRALLMQIQAAVVRTLGPKPVAKWPDAPAGPDDIFAEASVTGGVVRGLLGGLVGLFGQRANRLPARPKRPVRFTITQMKVILCVARYALTDVEIAGLLGVSVSAVKKHLQNIYEKLGFKETGAVGKTPRVRLAQHFLRRLLRPRRKQRRRYRFVPRPVLRPA